MNPEERKPRIKGSGDHDWEPWSSATLGRGRVCQRCGRQDDGYQQPCASERDDLGWWAIAGSELLAALRRAHSGEDPDLVYAELYANSDQEQVPPKEEQ